MLIKFLARGDRLGRGGGPLPPRGAGRGREAARGRRGAAREPGHGGRRGRHAGVRAQVHLRRDRLGPGGPTHRRADRGGPGRLREDGLGGTGARPIRLGRRAAPRARRRRSRPRPRRAVRPGDGPQPQHRAAGLGEDLRAAQGRLQPRTRLGSPGRPGSGQSAAARAPRLCRGGAVEGRPPARSLPPRPDPGLPASEGRARHGAESCRCRLRTAGGGPRSAAPGQGLPHRAGPRDRGPVAAERRTVWRELRARTI